MAAVINQQAVEQALIPWVGTGLVRGTALAEEAGHILRTYAPYKEDLPALAKRIDSFLFTWLHGLLGSSMTVIRDNGCQARIYVADLPLITDDLLGVLFDSLSPYSVNFALLKDYSMQTGSLSAMRVLYQKYDQFQCPAEKQIMARVIRENYPPWRYQHWLPAEA